MTRVLAIIFLSISAMGQAVISSGNSRLFGSSSVPGTVAPPPCPLPGVPTDLIAYNIIPGQTVPITTAQIKYLSLRSIAAYNPAGFNGVINMAQYNACMTQTGYTDSALQSPSREAAMISWCVGKSYTCENVWVHATSDYTASNGGSAWFNMDQFDIFEVNSGNNPVNGAFTIHTGTPTDRTSVFYAGGSTTIDDTMEVGYQQPFAKMIIVLGTNRSGGTWTWQYWNGSAWATLTVTDGTSGMTGSGTVTFTPPTDWARRVEFTSQSKYWVRGVVASAGTNPVVTTIKGDNWITGGHNRGWNASDPGIVAGPGGVSYNPTPPGGATASFRYQARINGIQVSVGFFNHSDIQSGHYTAGEWIAEVSRVQTDASPGINNGVFFDNGGRDPQVSGIGWPGGTDFNGGGQNLNQWMTAIATSILKAADALNTRYGASYYTTVNNASGLMGVGPHANAYIETAVNTFLSYIVHFVTQASPALSGSWSFDESLHANNPNDSKVTIAQNNNEYNGCASAIGQCNGTWHQFDRGNRGPILALAIHLIGANPNSRFAYSPTLSAYEEIDDFFYYSPTATGSLTATWTANPSGTVGTVAGSFTNLVGFIQRGASDGNLLAIPGCNFPNIAVRVSQGGNTDNTCILVNSSSQITFGISGFPTYATYTSGAVITAIEIGCQSGNSGVPWCDSALPSISNIYRWSMIYPAQSVDFGIPDAAGMNAGVRMVSTALDPASAPWVTSAANTNVGNCNVLVCADVWRRDYTKAIVIMRPYGGNGFNDAELDTAGKVLSLGSTYYPLQADGHTGAGVTTIQLRADEAFIGMKSPL